ncbi:hypothetical protein [Streptomyces specialis]|uniref:hypothetical protein n=1 Tax=Streptomyces specialis TaxID=498367 RepID=UPI00073E25A7|nr:hypothetical protein [Streptomyces specialis]
MAACDTHSDGFSKGCWPPVSGIVLAVAALVIVATTYTVQFVYKDYFDCVDDALTAPSREACETLLPEELRRILGEQD